MGLLYACCAGLLALTWLLPWTFIRANAEWGGDGGWARWQIDAYHALNWPAYAVGLAGLVHMLLSGATT